MQKALFETPLVMPNVAKVPQYSPFRYPGGKSRWYPFIRQWLLISSPTVMVEPFAGGAHVGLAAAVEQFVEHVVLVVELDENVAAVWETITNGNATWLMKQITAFEMTAENVEKVFDRKEASTRDRAFAMIVHNRISRGGITAPGAGRVRKGENGKGIKSRWYPETLVERIQRIAEAAGRIEFVAGDGLKVMEQYLYDEEAALFIDPPYPKACRRLYKHSDVDHERVFQMAREAAGPILLTYDNSEEVNGLVEKYGFQSERLSMSTTHHWEKYELLIGKDLGWLRGEK